MNEDDQFDLWNDDNALNPADDPLEKLKRNVVEINVMKNYHQSLHFN